MTNDLVSDMLTRIRNASLARHSFTRIQYSKLNIAVSGPQEVLTT
jgi:ribosomal protein S8